MSTEVKQRQTVSNGNKQSQTKSSETLSYEIPLSMEEALQMLTKWQRENRENKKVTAIGFRVSGGNLLVEVRPE